LPPPDQLDPFTAPFSPSSGYADETWWFEGGNYVHWWRMTTTGTGMSMWYDHYNPTGVRIYTWWYDMFNGSLRQLWEGQCSASAPCSVHVRPGVTYYIKTQIIEGLEPTGCSRVHFDP
jgi:hypothetical protein